MKLPYNEKDLRSIEKYAKILEDHKLNDLYPIDWNRDPHYDKGQFGKLIEELHFKRTPNNSPLPDFPEAGVELKTTGLIKVKDRLHAKERLKLNSLNYCDMDKEIWKKSHFLSKNLKTLLIAYLYNRNEHPMELIIKLCGLWEIPEKDLLIIRSDWEKIRAKINNNVPWLISEGDTLYLGACTSGSDSRETVVIPRSKRKVKARSLCFKKPYLDAILWELSMGKLGQKFGEEKIIKDDHELIKLGFEGYLINKFKPFIGKTIKQIAKDKKIKVSIKAKNYNDIISKAILGLKESPEKSEEFIKAGIALKSIAFERNGNLIESISFPYFKYDELVAENDWDSSTTREMFERKFFFVVYQKDNKNNKVLKGVVFWNIPLDDLDKQVKSVWIETIKRLRINPKSKLPGMKENPISHIRPHGRDAKDTYTTISGIKLKKYCFWFNAKYIETEIKKSLSNLRT